jgi:hypothetical protein
MSTKYPDLWKEIDALAESLGVSDWARRKWQQRGVIPHKWRLPLIEASKGKLTASDFNRSREAA